MLRHAVKEDLRGIGISWHDVRVNKDRRKLRNLITQCCNRNGRKQVPINFVVLML